MASADARQSAPLTAGAPGGAAELGHILSSWMIMPLIFLFFLRDTGDIKRGLLGVVPNRLFEPVLAVLADVDETLGGYVRRIFLECCTLGLTVMVMLTLVGGSLREGTGSQEALQRAHAELAHISRVTALGELAASIAHEVNQPIAAAITDASTCVRWLTREVPDLDEARQAAQRTVKDASRAADIIARIHRLFRRSGPDRECVNVNELVLDIVMLLRGEALRDGVAIGTALASDLPPVTGDRVQLQQVLLNLLMNSIEATKGVEGRREITVSSRPEGGDHVQVVVADTGVGLPATGQDEVFNAFFTTKPDGTGMGLSISRSIIEAHGGRLWATSNEPRGATFHFSLPVAPGPVLGDVVAESWRTSS